MSKFSEIRDGLLNVFVRTTPLAEDDKDIEQELSKLNEMTDTQLINNLEKSLSHSKTGKNMKKSVKARDSINVKSVQNNKKDNKEKINEDIKENQR